MRIPYQFRDVVLAALLLSCLAKVATAQQSAQQLDFPHFLQPSTGPLSRSDVRPLHRAPMGPRLYSSSGD